MNAVHESTRAKVRRIMSDGKWHTGLELAKRCGTQYATGIMAFVRKLRGEHFGGHTILSEYDAARSRQYRRQVWRYRMVIAEKCAG